MTPEETELRELRAENERLKAIIAQQRFVLRRTIEHEAISVAMTRKDAAAILDLKKPIAAILADEVALLAKAPT